MTGAWRWIDAILIDSRLGVRMLVKHRGLTLVGVFAMAVAIAVGATLFEVFSEMLDPTLPFAGGDRVVSLHYIGANPANPERRVLHDFAALHDQLVSVEHFGAFHDAEHNLVSATTAPEPVLVAEITASAFAIARTPALLGRHLLDTDELESAPPVAVIGYQAWQLRFGGDSNIVGRTIHLGGVPRTVVGVMPEGFKFPVDHQFWIPFHDNALNYQRWQGPPIYMFGRLAPGATIQHARAEFAAVSQRTAVAHPETQPHLVPVVVPYTYDHSGIGDPTFLWALRVGQLLVGALTFVVAINLAILVYARTVTRLGEIAVRSALGASRRRILAQLFIEALALSILGAGTGLVLAYLRARCHPDTEPPRYAVLDQFQAVDRSGALRVRIGARCGGHHGCAARHEGHGRGFDGKSPPIERPERITARADVDNARGRASCGGGRGVAGRGVRDLARGAHGSGGAWLRRGQVRRGKGDTERGVRTLQMQTVSGHANSSSSRVCKLSLA